MRLIYGCILLALSGRLASITLAKPPASQPVKVATTQVVRDLDDQPHTPLLVASGRRAVLLIFIASDCPISNGYAPTIAKLFRMSVSGGVDCFTVYCDATLGNSSAKAHHEQYGLPGEALLDPKQELAHLLGATRTPEAVVMGRDGMMLYRGRIDDLYVALGHKRFVATTHELRDVLDEVIAGLAVDIPWMQAIGCEIN